MPWILNKRRTEKGLAVGRPPTASFAMATTLAATTLASTALEATTLAAALATALATSAHHEREVTCRLLLLPLAMQLVSSLTPPSPHPPHPREARDGHAQSVR